MSPADFARYPYTRSNHQVLRHCATSMSHLRESYWSASTTDNRQSEIYVPFDATRDRRHIRSLSIYPEDESNPDIDTIPIGLPVAPAVPDKDHDHPYYRSGSTYRDPSRSTYRDPSRSTYRTSPNRIWQIPREASIEPLELKRPVAVDQLRWSTVSDESADGGMSRLHEFFFVTTVCMAQLCTRKYRLSNEAPEKAGLTRLVCRGWPRPNPCHHPCDRIDLGHYQPVRVKLAHSWLHFDHRNLHPRRGKAW